MVCARYRDALTELAAGAAASAALETHLTGCAPCRAKLVMLRQLLVVTEQELAQLSLAEPSGSFVPRIRAAMASQDTSARRAIWLWPSLATAAVLGLAFTLFVVMRPAREVAAVVEVSSTPEPVPAAASEPAPVKITEALPRSQRRASRHRPAEPQVLVPPGEARALVQWVALVNREQRVSALLAAADTPTNATPTSIEIQPIEFVPLDPATNPGT